ncbi:MAG: KEOPS complex subunit Pcc1 [Pyrodictiaceae archaeon]
MSRVSGYIEIKLSSRRLAESIARALSVEASSPPDPSRGSVRVITNDDKVIIEIKARDLPAARTLFTTFLGLASTVIDAVTSIDEKNQQA